VSTRPDDRMGSPSDYVFVDFGEEFRRDHATAFPDITTPMATFGSALLALDYLRDYGGSAYLPDRIAGPLIGSKLLHLVPGAPVFHRPVFFVCAKRIEELTPVIPAYLKELSN